MNKRANERELNAKQFEQLQTEYINTIVDSMSMEDFRQYVRNDMWDYLGNLSFSGVIEEVKYTLDDEMFEEFITTIKGQSS